MELKNVHSTMNSLETYLSRSNNREETIKLLNLTVLFDISESLKTISETLTDPDVEDGVIDYLQRINESFGDLTAAMYSIDSAITSKQINI